VLVVLRFAVDDEPEFLPAAHVALEALAARPGYQSGTLARAYDEPGVWCLVTTWASVGAYRRALGAYEVKLNATPLLARALPEASAFEPLATAGPGGSVTVSTSDRAGSTSEG
jgi:heme oxygenase (mycobilin-producing)